MTRTWIVTSSEDFGRAVAEVRRSRGKTQLEAATTVGLSRDWLAKLETGRSSKVVDHLLRLLRRMGATVTVTWDEANDIRS